MNTAKILAFTWSSLAVILNLVQAYVPFMPTVWAQFVTAILGLLTFYHIYQSHTPSALMAAGYTKTQ